MSTPESEKFNTHLFEKFLPIMAFFFAGWLAFNSMIFSSVDGIDEIRCIVSFLIAVSAWRLIDNAIIGYFSILAWNIGVGLDSPDLWFEYFDNHWGFAVLLAVSLLSSLPVLLIPRRYLNYGLGIIGVFAFFFPLFVCSPFILTMSLFPGLGFGGLLFSVVALLLPATRKKVFNSSLLIVLVFSVYKNLSYAEPALPYSIKNISTSAIDIAGKDHEKTRNKVKELIFNQLRFNNAKIIITPEALVSFDLDDRRDIEYWRDVQSVAINNGQQVLLGITNKRMNSEDSGSASVNGLLDVVSNKFYGQTMPMPFGMWQPWDNSENHFPIVIENILKRIPISFGYAAYLICYEELIPSILAAKMLFGERPVVLISSANHWFSKNNTGWLPQQRAIDLQARMWGIPLRRSINSY